MRSDTIPFSLPYYPQYLTLTSLFPSFPSHVSLRAGFLDLPFLGIVFLFVVSSQKLVPNRAHQQCYLKRRISHDLHIDSMERIPLSISSRRASRDLALWSLSQVREPHIRLNDLPCMFTCFTCQRYTTTVFPYLSHAQFLRRKSDQY